MNPTAAGAGSGAVVPEIDAAHSGIRTDAVVADDLRATGAAQRT